MCDLGDSCGHHYFVPTEMNIRYVGFGARFKIGAPYLPMADSNTGFSYRTNSN